MRDTRERELAREDGRAGVSALQRERSSQAAIAATSYFDNRSQWLRADGGITISPAKSEADR